MMKQFPLALMKIAERSQLGHEKYAETDLDWQGFSRLPVEDYQNAMIRHIFEHGEENETPLDHKIATAWCALAVLELSLR